MPNYLLNKEGLDRLLEVNKNTIDSLVAKASKEAKSNLESHVEDYESHIKDKNNPHDVTREQLGYSKDNATVKLGTTSEEDHVTVEIVLINGYGEVYKASNLIPQVTHEKAGLLIPVDKIKLDKLLFDETNHIDASILPSYVDDVIEGYINDGKLYLTRTEATDTDTGEVSYEYSDEKEGETGKIYVDMSTSDNKVYRYASDSGTFILVSDVPAAALLRIETLEGKTQNLKDNTTIVTKIKGSAEEEYRTDEVEISPENLGITVVNNTKDKDKSVHDASQLTTPRTIALTDGVTGTATEFDGTKDIEIPVTSLDASKLEGTAPVDTTGNAATATKLETARTIKLSGAVTGTETEFDGSQDIDIPVTEVDATKLKGIVPATNLPSYVDDVVEGYLNDGKFYTTRTESTETDEDGNENIVYSYDGEIVGETGKIYIDISTNDNKTYRYVSEESGYVLVSDVPEAVLKRINELETKTKNLDSTGIEYVPVTRTVNGHELKEDINITREDIGLGKVTNYNQAKAIYDITRVGTVFKLTHLDGTQATVDQQDFDTTYDAVPVGTDDDSADTESICGMFKALGMTEDTIDSSVEETGETTETGTESTSTEGTSEGNTTTEGSSTEEDTSTESTESSESTVN